MAAARVRINTVDRSDVTGGAVHVEHRRAQFCLQPRRYGPRPVTADQEILATHYGSVHRVVKREGDETAILALQPDQIELPVHWAIRIEPQRDAPVFFP